MKARALHCVVACCLVAAVAGCDESKPQAAAATAAAPPTAAAAPAPTPSAAAAAAPASDKGARPSKIDTELTAARRAAIEAKHPGFVAASELETKLKANKALKDKKTGIAAFDKLASGKWVLFTGPLVNLTDAGFDVGIEYTPQLPNDPMGMSRQFFEVTLTNVEGYAKDSFKDGNVVVVIAKYNGGGKASSGQELVASGDWK